MFKGFFLLLFSCFRASPQLPKCSTDEFQESTIYFNVTLINRYVINNQYFTIHCRTCCSFVFIGLCLPVLFLKQFNWSNCSAFPPVIHGLFLIFIFCLSIHFNIIFLSILRNFHVITYLVYICHAVFIWTHDSAGGILILSNEGFLSSLPEFSYSYFPVGTK